MNYLKSRDARAAPGKVSANVVRLALNFHRRKEWTSSANRAYCRRAEIRAGWPIRDLAPLAMPPLRGFGGDGAGTVTTEKDPQMSQSKISRKTEIARAKSRTKRPAKPGKHSSGFDPRWDQAGGRSHPAQTAQGYNDRRHHEGNGLAAALGPRLLCGCGAQETRLNTDIGEGRRRTHLSCDCQPA